MAHKKRDDAFEKWRTEQTGGPLRDDTRERELRTAFNAGWLARKTEEYST